MAKAPMMPLWTDALIGDTTHLSAEQFGCYVLILIATWRNNGKALPDDDARMSKICKITVTKWRRKLRPILSEFFDISESVWRQQRLEKEWVRVKRALEQKSTAASSGGQRSVEAKRKRKLNGRSTNHNHIKKTPSSKSESDAARAFALADRYRTRDDNTWIALGNVVAKAIGNEIPDLCDPAAIPVSREARRQEHLQWLHTHDRETLDVYLAAALSDDAEAAERMFNLVEKQIGGA